MLNFAQLIWQLLNPNSSYSLERNAKSISGDSRTAPSWINELGGAPFRKSVRVMARCPTVFDNAVKSSGDGPELESARATFSGISWRWQSQACASARPPVISPDKIFDIKISTTCGFSKSPYFAIAVAAIPSVNSAASYLRSFGKFLLADIAACAESDAPGRYSALT